MDWDDTTFDTDEFELHFKRLNILENHTVDELKKRTTKNTRSGREFGFKPTHLAIGSVVSSRFHVGFESTVDRDGRHPHNDDESLPSSFWIRFADSEKWFQIRAMCSDYDAPSVRPYECRIPFRDCVPGGIKLRALYRKAEDRVTVSLTIQSRRPPRYTQYLNPVLKIGREAIYDRHATKADFFQPPELERSAGAIRVKVERDYDLRIAVREAYARAAATAVERIKAYLDEHPSGQGAPADRRAWALASYKLTYDHDQFAWYFRIDWTSIDADVFAEREEDEELEAEFQKVATTDATQSTGRRFSFAWLLSDEIFDLLATEADAMKGHNSNPELILPSS